MDDRAVHSIYRPLVDSGLAFGAKRWVATLERQCERLASVMASNIPTGDGKLKEMNAHFLKFVSNQILPYKLE